MKIVCLGHYSRTGKDTLANALIESIRERVPRWQVKKLPFALKMKEILHQLYAWAGHREPEFYETEEGASARDIVLPALGLTPVELWVKFGTDLMREGIHPETWVNYVLENEHDVDVLIVTDLRFPNEHAAARRKGAKMVKVVRPGKGPRPTKADRALLGCLDWDLIVGSSGEIRELKEWADRLACEITGDRKFVQYEAEKREALKVEVYEPCEHDPAVPYQGGYVVSADDRVPALLSQACCHVVRRDRAADMENLRRINAGEPPVTGFSDPRNAPPVADVKEMTARLKEELGRRTPDGPPGQGSRSAYGGPA
jgi:hypothetical protein